MTTARAPGQFSIFGGVERARDQRPRHSARPNGYAAAPGSGPGGETCGTCRFCRTRQRKRSYQKCALMLSTWTNERSTDVLLHSPACAKWAAGEPRATTIQTSRKPR